MTQKQYDEKIENLEKEIIELKKAKVVAEIEKYPAVKISQDPCYNGRPQIVLFTAPKTGVNINGKGHPAGTSATTWFEDDFKPFTGLMHFVDGVCINES